MTAVTLERTIERESVATRDVDEARSLVGDLFCPHGLEPRGPHTAIDVHLRASRAGAVGVVHLDYGSTVEITPEPLNSFYLVQIPQTGTARIVHGGTEIRSDRAQASVLSPDAPSTMTWFSGNPQLCIYLDRRLVESALAGLLGQSDAPAAPIAFSLGMPLSSAPARSWLATVECLRAELETGRRDGSGPISLDHADALGWSVATQLLETHTHNYTAALLAQGGAPAGTVKRAIAVIEQHLDEPLTVSAVAAAVGVCTRVLQDAFCRELNTTPLAYLRERRMRLARARLLAGSSLTTSVTDIALGLGHNHLGRFSVEYKARYGETPSATLARA